MKSIYRAKNMLGVYLKYIEAIKKDDIKKAEELKELLKRYNEVYKEEYDEDMKNFLI